MIKLFPCIYSPVLIYKKDINGKNSTARQIQVVWKTQADLYSPYCGMMRCKYWGNQFTKKKDCMVYSHKLSWINTSSLPVDPSRFWSWFHCYAHVTTKSHYLFYGCTAVLPILCTLCTSCFYITAQSRSSVNCPAMNCQAWREWSKDHSHQLTRIQRFLQ